MQLAFKPQNNSLLHYHVKQYILTYQAGEGMSAKSATSSLCWWRTDIHGGNSPRKGAVVSWCASMFRVFFPIFIYLFISGQNHSEFPGSVRTSQNLPELLAGHTQIPLPGHCSRGCSYECVAYLKILAKSPLRHQEVKHNTCTVLECLEQMVSWEKLFGILLITS